MVFQKKKDDKRIEKEGEEINIKNEDSKEKNEKKEEDKNLNSGNFFIKF